MLYEVITRYCEWACPYGAPQFDEEAGVMTKCNLCADLLDKGQNPACVDACVMRALDFGEFVITSYSIHYTKLYDGNDHPAQHRRIKQLFTNRGSERVLLHGIEAKCNVSYAFRREYISYNFV